jgi:uncharacterized protein YegP (UPF0339 family)
LLSPIDDEPDIRNPMPADGPHAAAAGAEAPQKIGNAPKRCYIARLQNQDPGAIRRRREARAMAAEFELYKDGAGEYRWRLQAGNNKIVADSAEAYESKAGAEEGIRDVQRIAPTAPVNDKT